MLQGVDPLLAEQIYGVLPNVFLRQIKGEKNVFCGAGERLFLAIISGDLGRLLE